LPALEDGRGRIDVYDRYVGILDEGTGPLS
jgi:hypothetical protein